MKTLNIHVGSAAIGAVLALSLTCSFASAQEPALQADWIQSPINGNWYGVDYTNRNWTESEAVAVSLGGHLATIRSQAEQDWIVSNQGQYLAGQVNGGLWVGLSDNLEEGTYVWSSGEPLSYGSDTSGGVYPWGSGEPNDAISVYVEDGVLLHSGEGAFVEAWDWHDASENWSPVRPLFELPTKPQVGWSWPTRTASVSGPYWGCLADLDGDQDLDYVVPAHGQGTSGSAIAVFINDGGGVFSPGPTVSLGASRPYDVKAIDHDQDGAPDLVVTVHQDQKLLLVENEGSLVFTTDPTPLLTGADFHNLIAMHVDGDGVLDLVVSAWNADSIHVGIGQPGGGFSFSSAVPVGQAPRFLASGDLNGDTFADVVVSCRDGDEVEVYQNDGTGLLTLLATLAVTGPTDVSVADLDDDGDLDISSLSEQGQAYVWANDGAGNFSALGGPVPCGVSPNKSAVGDLDVDGDLDIVVSSSGASELVVLWNDGAGAYPQTSLLSNHSDPRDVLVGDLDGNGSLDVLGSDYSSDAFVVHMNQTLTDCNDNGIHDFDDIANGSPDCNANLIPDTCDIADSSSQDCDANGVPDECQPDCDSNGVADQCDITAGTSPDCNSNGVPDECDIGADPSADCNGNGVLDICDIVAGTSVDCDFDNVPDECLLPSYATLYCYCDSNAPCGNASSSAGCANSAGIGSLLTPCGTASVVADDLLLNAIRLAPNQFGIFFMAGSVGSFAFGDGQRCAVGAAYRLSLHYSGPSGTVTGGPGLAAFSAAQFNEPGQIDPGETWNFQYWYRDALGPCGSSFNLTNAVAVTFAP